MLGLPKSTEVKKHIPKKIIHEELIGSAWTRFDMDVKSIYIVNEISILTTNLRPSEEFSSIYVLHVIVNRKNYDENSILLITKLIKQKMLLIIQYDEYARLAVYHTKLVQSDWTNIFSIHIELNGLYINEVWEDIVTKVGSIRVEEGRTLDEQIKVNEFREKIQKEIDMLEKKIASEKQLRKKFEMHQQILKLRMQLLECNRGK